MIQTLDFIIAMMMALALAACSSTIPGLTTASSTPVETAAQPPASEVGPAAETKTVARGAPTLTLIGHASLKIKTAEGTVVYIDPYYQGDYSEKADLILVSHEHSDHNAIHLVTQNEGCVTLTVKETINPAGNSYNTFEYFGVKIEPVPASNKNHPLKSTNGFVLTFDGIKVYVAADTSKLDQMADLKAKNIDYAFFPIDGFYNMDAAEAMESAAMVGAKHNIPYHIRSADVTAFTPENLLLMDYGETIELAAQ